MIDLEELLEQPAQRFVNFWRKHLVSILLILIFNTLIVILLMAMRLSTYRTDEHQQPVAIEFDDPSERQELEKLYKEYQELIQAKNTAPIRNIAVDATQPNQLNAGLSDDKHVNANEIYDEMNRLRNELAQYKEEREQRENSKNGDVEIPDESPTPTKNDNLYQGPSVLSYVLEERSPVTLPVPAYRCQTSGIVVVIIHVNKTGAVINAGINKPESQNSECLYEAALKAAYRSRFNASAHAPELQVGMITYQFVRQ